MDATTSRNNRFNQHQKEFCVQTNEKYRSGLKVSVDNIDLNCDLFPTVVKRTLSRDRRVLPFVDFVWQYILKETLETREII